MKKRTLYVFIGPPGSGKGTLSQKCVQELEWEQISTGNLCRKHIEEQTPIGKEIDFAIKSGKLVDDSLITKMVFDWFAQLPQKGNSIILDGYPRTVAQAETFNEFVSSVTFPFDVKVIKFTLDDTTLIERLGRRFICRNKECQTAYAVFPGSKLAPKKEAICDRCGSSIGRRKDDMPEAIKERLKGYHQHEKELIDCLKKAGHTVYEFSTNKPIKDLFYEFKEEVRGR